MSKIIVCNWKMKGSVDYCNQVKKIFSKSNYQNIFDIIICPPYTLLNQMANQPFSLGVQNCSAEIDNYYTGEISIEMLKEYNISHAIIGHSERRKHFNETEDMILKKLSLLLESSIVPIICVRRVSEDRDYIQNIIRIFTTFEMCNSNKKQKIYIAYEPDHSIGSGISDNLYSIEENCLGIKSISKNNPNAKILYGGSVNHKNIQNILNICDGVLLGKASTDLDEFLKILQTDLNYMMNSLENQKTYSHLN